MLLEMLYGSSANMHSLTQSYGGHYGSSMDPIAAWEGEMNMWDDPRDYDVSYHVKFDDPVELMKLSLVFDGGATVRVTSVDGKVEFGSQDCDGGYSNKEYDCFVAVDAGYVSEVRVVIDSSEWTWNWMGNYTFWDIKGRSLRDDWLTGQTLIKVDTLYGSTENVHDLMSTFAGHYGTSKDPLAAWAGEMNMWAYPNSYDVMFHVTFDNTVQLSHLSLVYDAGATVMVTSPDGVTEYGKKECYETNGYNTNNCIIQIVRSFINEVRVVLNSSRTTWNWMGDFILWDINGVALLNHWGTEQILFTVETLYGSASDMHDLGSQYGGHYGTSLDPIAAWAEQMNMWASPNTYDVLYNVTFNNAVNLSKLSLVYDAGAKVSVTSIDGETEFGREDCYKTNGWNVNDCIVNISKSYAVDEVLVVIDSNHGNWNWMGDYKFWDINGQPISDHYISATPTRMPSVPNPTAAPSLLMTSYPTFNSILQPTLGPTPQKTKMPSMPGHTAAPSLLSIPYPTLKPTTQPGPTEPRTPPPTKVQSYTPTWNPVEHHNEISPSKIISFKSIEIVVLSLFILIIIILVIFVICCMKKIKSQKDKTNMKIKELEIEMYRNLFQKTKDTEAPGIDQNYANEGGDTGASSF